MTGSWEQRNEAPRSITCTEVLDYRNVSWILKDSAPWSSLHVRNSYNQWSFPTRSWPFVCGTDSDVSTRKTTKSWQANYCVRLACERSIFSLICDIRCALRGRLMTITYTILPCHRSVLWLGISILSFFETDLHHFSFQWFDYQILNAYAIPWSDQPYSSTEQLRPRTLKQYQTAIRTKLRNVKSEESIGVGIANAYGDRTPVGARFSAPVQTGPEAHPASCTMGTGSFPGVRCGRGVTLTPHPLLLLRSKIK